MKTEDVIVVFSIALFVIAVVVILPRVIRRYGGWDATDFFSTLAMALLWDLAFLMLLPLMLFLAGFIGFFLWLASIVIALIIVTRHRQAERRALVWAMSVAAEKSIPLSTAVRAFATERRGSFAYRARRLAKALDDGKTLDAALKQSGIRLPDDTLVALRMGAETGKLHESLKAAVRNSVHIDNTIQSALGQLAYLATVLLFVGGTLAFFMIKIMPAFIKIFSDFHRRLPEAAILVVRDPHGANLMCLFAAFVLLLVVIRFSGLLRWDPPFLRRLWRHLDESTVLRSLALTVDRQDALPATLATLSEKYPKRHIRKRLRRAAERATAGADWCDALHSAGLLERADAGVLQAAQRVGNLSWALNATADRLVRRFITRMTMLSSVGFPLLLLLISAVVCLLAISVFASLANLITGLA